MTQEESWAQEGSWAQECDGSAQEKEEEGAGPRNGPQETKAGPQQMSWEGEKGVDTGGPWEMG